MLKMQQNYLITSVNSHILYQFINTYQQWLSHQKGLLQKR